MCSQIWQLSQFAAGIHKKSSCLTSVAAMFITASHRFVFGMAGLLHKHKPVFVSGCPAIPLEQDTSFGCFVTHTLQVETSISAALLYFFCERTGRLGTVDFGGQVTAVILFLNAICSQAGTEPLGVL